MGGFFCKVCFGFWGSGFSLSMGFMFSLFWAYLFSWVNLFLFTKGNYFAVVFLGTYYLVKVKYLEHSGGFVFFG